MELPKSLDPVAGKATVGKYGDVATRQKDLCEMLEAQIGICKGPCADLLNSKAVACVLDGHLLPGVGILAQHILDVKTHIGTGEELRVSDRSVQLSSRVIDERIAQT